MQATKTGYDGTDYKWRITQAYVHRLHDELAIDSANEIETTYVNVARNVLTLREGYEWNGADFFPDLDWMLAPSAVHDALYQLTGQLARTLQVNEYTIRLRADRELYCMIHRNNRPRWAAMTYKAIRKFQHRRLSAIPLRLVRGLLGGLSGLASAPDIEC